MLYNSTPMIILYIALFVLFVIALFLNIRKAQKRNKQLLQYWQVYQGMPESEMLSIMGSGYSRNLLKNNRIKYEWRISAISHGSSFKGYSVRSYTGVKKVSIYVKNGYVEEVKTLNI